MDYDKNKYNLKKYFMGLGIVELFVDVLMLLLLKCPQEFLKIAPARFINPKKLIEINCNETRKTLHFSFLLIQPDVVSSQLHGSFPNYLLTLIN